MKFKIYEKENKQIIERLEYPRFTAEITFRGVASDLENVDMKDDCNDAMVLARAMREAGEFIVNYNKGNKK